MEARGWLRGLDFPPDRPLIDVSQAAPMLPPPASLRQAIAQAALDDPQAHLYGPVLGLPDLRTEIAARWSSAYGGRIAADEVAITQGCNQAFCAIMATIAGPGDEVILPVPWYFNHRMWLEMQGVTPMPLPTDAHLLPDPDAARALITSRTRAIVLVSPNNPGGVEYPASVLRAFCDLAREHDLALVVDETYRDFDSRPDRPHDLFADDGWRGTLVHLYSFSKIFRLTGHRVGAIIADADRLAQVEKFLDTVAICPSQLGQIAALWGLRNLGDWVAAERAEILARRDVLTRGLDGLSGWRLKGCGAFFALVEHPHPLPSPELARRLVAEAGVLTLPGTMFRPAGDPDGARELRLAFANIDRAGIETLIARLAHWRP